MVAEFSRGIADALGVLPGDQYRSPSAISRSAEL